MELRYPAQVARLKVQDDGFGLTNLLGACPAYGVPTGKS